MVKLSSSAATSTEGEFVGMTVLKVMRGEEAERRTKVLENEPLKFVVWEQMQSQQDSIEQGNS